MFRDGADLRPSQSGFLSKNWWVSRRFFWERTLNQVPHCVVFVFDGSHDPFLDSESLEFFQQVFKDCSKHGMYDGCVCVRACMHVCVVQVSPFLLTLSAHAPEG